MTDEPGNGDPWGRSELPAVSDEDLQPLPRPLADIEAMLEAGEDRPLAPGDRLRLPGLADLPEVAALADEGWEPLPIGFMGWEWALLPAVWPREHRQWVRDRMPRFALMTCDDETVLAPEMGRDTHQQWLLARMARSVDLPPPPRDRIWLLRSPWPSLPVSSLLLLIGQHRDRKGLGWDALANMRAAEDLLSRSEDEVWALWTGRQADAARRWVAEGQGARGAEHWIRLALGPHHLATLLAPLEAGGAGLTALQARQWCEITSMREEPGDDVVRRTIEWRRAGLPADADVERLGMVLLEHQPDEVAQWLESGLTPDDVAVWQAEDLTRALRWRDAGFGAKEAQALVLADPTLTPEEARAFDVTGIDAAVRHRWVAAGFTPEQARAWTDLDIVAAEARVWRSLDRGPEEARAHRAAGGDALPPGFEGGWAAFGSDRDDVSYGVTDPPGTRGTIAGIGPDGIPLP